jgi:hypothetical protein
MVVCLHMGGSRLQFNTFTLVGYDMICFAMSCGNNHTCSLPRSNASFQFLIWHDVLPSLAVQIFVVVIVTVFIIFICVFILTL